MKNKYNQLNEDQKSAICTAIINDFRQAMASLGPVLPDMVINTNAKILADRIINNAQIILTQNSVFERVRNNEKEVKHKKNVKR